ncbi:serine/threonine-protein kinase PINK1-like protein, partial [Dinothrombium tinctorium]
RQCLVRDHYRADTQSIGERLLHQTRVFLRTLLRVYNRNGRQTKSFHGNIVNKSNGRRLSINNQLIVDSKSRASIVGRLVSKWVSNSIAADIRRNATRQLLFKGPGLGLGLVGVCINNKGPSLLTEIDETEAKCQQIRSIFSTLFTNYQIKSEAAEPCLFDLNNLQFGNCIAKGCNAVVYDAKLKGNTNQFAVKMMFNYDAESNAAAIWKAMNKECITFNGNFSSNKELEIMLNTPNRQKLKPHPNIIEIKGVFADYVPSLPEAIELYPNALPLRLCDQGFGRNMTLFLVMKKYDMSLKTFLVERDLKTQTSLFLLSQLFEGISHLIKHKIVHRDIKTDNILLDLSSDPDFPWLVITDFGFCVNSLRIPLNSDEITRGGNRALMAPEIVCAEPGPFSYIDYSASDLWSCGTIAYEIFNAENPFYPNKSKKYLQNNNYKEEHLPIMPPSTPKPIAALIFDILKRNPSERPHPKVAASLCEMLLFFSRRNLMVFKTQIDRSEVYKSRKLLQWLRALATITLCQRNTMTGGRKLNAAEMKLRLMFLSEVKIEYLLPALSYISTEEKI